MKNIAFVSLGNQSVKCANFLVKSIKKYNSNFQIIQISSAEDKTVLDINEKFIFDFNLSKFMLNRLESQIEVVKKYGPTIFLDSDMLVNDNLNSIFDLLTKYDLIFTKRKNNFFMQDTFFNQEHGVTIKFNEFKNKKINEVMPFNGGFLGVSNTSSLEKLLDIYLKLNLKFHYWYGDQIALKKIYDTNEYKIYILDSNYNHNVKNLTDYEKKVFVYHFKGRFKALIEPFYNKYLK